MSEFRRHDGSMVSKLSNLVPILIIVLCLALGLGLVFIYVGGSKQLTNSVTAPELNQAELNSSRFSEVFEQFGIDPLPHKVVNDIKTATSLETLAREKCDSAAVFDLHKALRKLTFRREAAMVLVSFSNKCGMHEGALGRAYHTYGEINDHAEQIKIANKLIEHKEFVPDFYYWRGLGLMKRGDHAPALDDFITTVELHPHLKRVSSTVFVNQAKMYQKLGRVCEAVTPVRTWVSLDPVKRDTAQSRGLIAKYEEQGNCASKYTSGTAKIRQRSSKAILVRAKVNGVSGKFLLDTGASYVSVNRSFAERAKLQQVAGSKVLLRTANGMTVGRVAVADSIAVQTAKAHQVTVVTLSGSKDQLGKEIDGLLGLSYLARFDMQFANGVWTLNARPRS